MERAPVDLWMCLWKIVLIALINVGGPSSLCPANAVLYKKSKLSINHSRVYHKTWWKGVSLLGFHFRVLSWLLVLTSLRSGLWAETNPLPTELPLVSSSSRKEAEQTPSHSSRSLEPTMLGPNTCLSRSLWDYTAGRKGREARMGSMAISRYFHLHSSTSTLDTSGYVTEACSGT